jgi:hypothetical protein
MFAKAFRVKQVGTEEGAKLDFVVLLEIYVK